MAPFLVAVSLWLSPWDGDKGQFSSHLSCCSRLPHDIPVSNMGWLQSPQCFHPNFVVPKNTRFGNQTWKWKIPIYGGFSLEHLHFWYRDVLPRFMTPEGSPSNLRISRVERIGPRPWFGAGLGLRFSLARGASNWKWWIIIGWLNHLYEQSID